jgi:hypothetical protein
MRKKEVNIPAPSAEEVQDARQLYRDESAWDLSYRGVQDGLERAMNKTSQFTVAEEIVRFLLEWNHRWFNLHGLRQEDVEKLDESITRSRASLMSFRARKIESFNPQDEVEITRLFSDFRSLVGPTGAAKALHVLAPSFFVPWDSAMRNRYWVGSEADGYLAFMRTRQAHCAALSAAFDDPIKALDEWDWVGAWLSDRHAPLSPPSD